MTFHQTVAEPARAAAAPRADGPEPISLETLAALEQLFARVLDELHRTRAHGQAAEAGAIEYASWLPPRH
ncbi:hypothetical protein WG922_20830 [Ramlibacter sp. AN1015]|uniref:hypothetical protein n=1 Tax=Ramlibacter sp. AN1015 TaxID=3133428 RepID=UPI0030C0EE9F